MCSIWEFAEQGFVRDGCTKCMSVCYRDSSVLYNFPVAIGDALQALRRGRPIAAYRAVATESSRRSIKALLQEWRTLKKLAKVDAGNGAARPSPPANSRHDMPEAYAGDD